MLNDEPVRTRCAASPDRERFCSEDLTARRIALVFILYGLLATTFLAINLPPFQNPDEPAHFLRAAQLADGGLIGTRFAASNPDGSQLVQAGGLADPALLTALIPFHAVIAHPDTKVTRNSWVPRVHWSNTRTMTAFPNTAVYPPLFYVPSAVGIRAGRIARATVVQTLTVSRLLTGVTAVAVGAVAIACAGAASLWIFAILTLPISLSTIASSSQDALILVVSALAGALLARSLQRPDERNASVMAWLTVALGLVAMARPPYGALATLPLALTRAPWRWRMLMAVTVAACVTIWSGIAAATALTNPGAFLGTDPSAQIAHLFADPILIVHVAWETLSGHWKGYIVEFVGVLGWLDTPLPVWYYTVALTMLGITAFATALESKWKVGVSSRLTIVAGLLISTVGMFAIQYLTWTVPGRSIVDGVQGRYLLPLALLGAALLPTLGNTRLARLHQPLVVIVLAFPLVSLAVIMRAVVLRYYLT